MNEEEWLAAISPGRMLWYVNADAGGRKPYLFSAACLRRIVHFMPGPASSSVATLLEQLADGEAVWDALVTARVAAREEVYAVESTGRHPGEYAALAASDSGPEYIADWAAEATAWARVGTPEATSTAEEQVQADFARDIFGNPFCPVAFLPVWRTDTAVSIARQMHESRDFGAMPILADALQDAGCDSPDILDHCRGDGPHVRGCWVVDLVLGKE